MNKNKLIKVIFKNYYNKSYSTFSTRSEMKLEWSESKLVSLSVASKIIVSLKQSR